MERWRFEGTDVEADEGMYGLAVWGCDRIGDEVAKYRALPGLGDRPAPHGKVGGARWLGLGTAASGLRSLRQTGTWDATHAAAPFQPMAYARLNGQGPAFADSLELLRQNSSSDAAPIGSTAATAKSTGPSEIYCLGPLLGFSAVGAMGLEVFSPLASATHPNHCASFIHPSPPCQAAA